MMDNRLQCISVGLALETISVQSIHWQQSGWNRHSWALHGDDGQIYHGSSGSGSAFRPLLTSPSAPKPVSPPRFGAGDVVGCGLVDLGGSSYEASGDDDDEGTFQGIFFTLNGEFLGVAFLLRSDAGEGLPLRPCVGIDAHWLIDFNFGGSPFAFDVDDLAVGQLKDALRSFAKAKLSRTAARIEQRSADMFGGTRRRLGSSSSESDAIEISSDSSSDSSSTGSESSSQS